ncbi:hypothetical protein D3P04_15040 [Paracoccus onubensis]|uniref:Uncharacterized protein n=1 Tax=Paracoccus onubensis TaxID=1675788 RepID=A0A418SRW8_9RHOB|nr:hypothetical protein D3P04_15040 [Paracoccus onubensis]
MNASQLINMFIRLIMRRLMNKGINKGFDALSKRKPTPGKGRPRNNGPRSDTRRVKQALRMLRRMR